MAARGADFLERGILDSHAGPAVDQQQLPFERREPRRLFGEHGSEHRTDTELLGAVALQREFRDAAFDDLNAERAALNVLRRNHRPAEVKARGAIDVADRARDRGQIGLRYLFSDIGLIRRNQPLARYRGGPGDRDMPKHEQRFGIPLPLSACEFRRRQSRPPFGTLARLLVLEASFSLPGIVAGLVGVLRLRRGFRPHAGTGYQANPDTASNGDTSP